VSEWPVPALPACLDGWMDGWWHCGAVAVNPCHPAQANEIASDMGNSHDLALYNDRMNDCCPKGIALPLHPRWLARSMPCRPQHERTKPRASSISHNIQCRLHRPELPAPSHADCLLLGRAGTHALNRGHGGLGPGQVQMLRQLLRQLLSWSASIPIHCDTCAASPAPILK
jgi:hypothetical protein